MTTTKTRCSSNGVRPGKVVRCNAVTDRSKLTFKVPERCWWRWCRREVRVFSPVPAIKCPHVSHFAGPPSKHITLFPIHVYIFICIYPYLRSSTCGFIPNNCMLSSKTLNISPVSLTKLNYAKYRRGSGSKTSSRGSSSFSCSSFFCKCAFDDASP